MEYKFCKICSSNIDPYLSQFGLMKCQKCGLIFSSESLQNKFTEELYDDLYSNDKAYEQHNKQANLIRRGIQPKLGKNKKIVIHSVIKKNRKYTIGEIGAGVGLVGKKLTDEGHNYTGFEINSRIAADAKASGVRIIASGFEGLVDYENHFDAIFAFEVLEHIDNLAECLNLIVRALKKEGQLGFTVPNSDKYKNFEKVQSNLFQSSPPVHLNFLNIENLKKILPLFGFHLIMLKVRPFPYLNLKDINTYKFIVKAFMHQYYGPNIMCVAKKED